MNHSITLTVIVVLAMACWVMIWRNVVGRSTKEGLMFFGTWVTVGDLACFAVATLLTIHWV